MPFPRSPVQPRPLFLALLLAVAAASLAPAAGTSPAPPPPPLPREFRAVWIATVDNIDWPSRAGLPPAEQRREFLAILDRARECRLNAVVFQVRPACDALYESPLEPWSEYLTGAMGRAPEPKWDPLAFAVEEAHRRGLELHAWFNPYRARHFKTRGPVSANHISRTRPELVRSYGRYLWLDPGDPEVRRHSLDVILDVVRRYDVDGVHLDDYFYPYRERGPAGPLPFPDDATWRSYREGGGTLSRDDWRRENVNRMVQELYQRVKREKRGVKVGLSPFGIWRPGHPPGIRGLDAYAELYADARLWFRRGWVDYLAPQLYWPISPPAQSYTALLAWWKGENQAGRHLWPGNNLNAPANGQWPRAELGAQIRHTRAAAGGNILYSARVLTRNTGGIAEYLREQVYPMSALPPASPWLAEGPPPPAPEARLHGSGAAHRLEWKPGGRGRPGAPAARWWAVQVYRGGAWSTTLYPGAAAHAPLEAGWRAAAVRAVDAAGQDGPPAVVTPD